MHLIGMTLSIGATFICALSMAPVDFSEGSGSADGPLHIRTLRAVATIHRGNTARANRDTPNNVVEVLETNYLLRLDKELLR